MYDKITYKETKPKVFYDTIRLLEKINTATKNINKYERQTILEPYILNNLSKVLENTAKVNIFKEIPKTKKINYINEAISNLDLSREFFIYFTENKNLKYGLNFIYEINMEYESIIKQLNGWKKYHIKT